MKESLSAIPKQPVFRETFTDEQTTRLNGGTIETPITFTNGVANFTPLAKGVLYNFAPKLFSVRIKFSNRVVNAQDNYLFGSIETTKYVLILNNNNLYTGLGSFAATYINGIATNSLGTLTSGEIIVTGFSNYTAASFRLGGKNTIGLGFEGSLELVEIYDYTLTANEVKNLYEGKRNRIIDLKQTATSIDNYYQGVGVSGNYVSTPNASANQITGDIEIIAKIDFSQASGRYTIVSSWGGPPLIGFTIFIQAGIVNYECSVAGGYNLAASTVAISTIYSGFLKVTRIASSGIVKFFTSTDGITYTQLGANVATTAGNQVASSLALQVGRHDATLFSFLGKISRLTISNSIGGAPVVDFNPQLYVSGTTLPSSTGETWTINGTQGFIGNGSRPEILNIDGRNGVIANKYNPENLLTYSEQFDNAVWAKTGVTITANSVNSPTGTLTADLVTPTISDAKFSQGFIPTSAIQHNFSVYLRSATGSSFSTVLRITRDSPFTNVANTVITVTTEWQRFDLTFTTLDATTHQATIGAGSTLSTGENLYIWGAQLNQDTIKPYVQTLATNVTSLLVNTAVTPVRQGSVWGMDFNGSTSKLDCGNYDSLLGDVTFIAWYKAATLGSGSAGRIIDNGQMQIHSGGYFTRNSSTFINFISAWKLGIWTQVVITSTSTGLTNTYINGVLVGSANQNAGSPVAGSNNILLGNNNSSNRCFNGKGSQIRIIKGILNAQECQQLFDNERHDYNI